jgi:hypothetical protein
MKSVTHQSTLHLSFKIKCCVDRLRPPGESGHEADWLSLPSLTQSGHDGTGQVNYLADAGKDGLRDGGPPAGPRQAPGFVDACKTVAPIEAAS